MLNQRSSETKELLDSLGAIVWEQDVATHALVYINQAAQKVLGYRQEEWKARPDLWHEILHPADRQLIEAMSKPSAKANEQSRSQQILCRRRNAQGVYVWFEEIVNI